MSKATVQCTQSDDPSPSSTAGVTIGKLAKAAEVGVETVRYYQRRHLLAVPHSAGGGVRRYPSEMIDRIRFIKRSQSLGFSLDEIRELPCPIIAALSVAPKDMTCSPNRAGAA